jgi:hypothetical protein
MAIMTKMLLSVFLVIGMAGACAAQGTPAASTSSQQPTTTAPGSPTPAASPSQFPAGTIIPIELSKSVDTKKAKVGDKIEARIPSDLLSQGKVVIPRDSKIFGHVTDVKAHTKESPDSKVGLAFDRMQVKKGGEVPLQVTVQAVGRPLQMVDSPAHMNEGAGTPSAAPSTAGGSNMGGSVPSRSQERVASIPTDAGGQSDAVPSTTMAPLGPTSQGVVGMKGLELSGSVISSQTDNVHLDTGTQMILRAN